MILFITDTPQFHINKLLRLDNYKTSKESSRITLFGLIKPFFEIFSKCSISLATNLATC